MKKGQVSAYTIKFSKANDNKKFLSYLPKRLDIFVFPLPGSPQKQKQNLSVAIGKILSGILFSSVCPMAACDPITRWGKGLKELLSHS